MTMANPSDKTTMGADVSAALRERLSSDGVEVERVQQRPFVCILTLGSGARLGLTIGSGDDDPAQWAMVAQEKLCPFAPDRVIKFVELIETARADIEDRIEKSAAALGLPGESVLFSFPVLEFARAMFEKQRPHFSRLCLMWLLPSELRPLRPEIRALVDDELMPRQVRDLAERLVVPE